MILGGPQKGRDRLWIGKEENIDNGVLREDLVLDKATENQIYEGEIAHLTRENAALKDQLQRSLRELREYQVKYPSAYMTLPDDNDDDGDPIWSISAEAMTPLIAAYDSRIRELQDAVKTQTAQMERMHGEFQEIISENESLRDNQLENLKNSARGRGSGNLEPFAPVNSEMLAEMNERVDILMSENALLLEQKGLLKAELDR